VLSPVSGSAFGPALASDFALGPRGDDAQDRAEISATAGTFANNFVPKWISSSASWGCAVDGNTGGTLTGAGELQTVRATQKLELSEEGSLRHDVTCDWLADIPSGSSSPPKVLTMTPSEARDRWPLLCA